MVLKLSEPPEWYNGNSTFWTAWGDDEPPKGNSGCLIFLLFLIILLLIYLICNKVL